MFKWQILVPFIPSTDLDETIKLNFILEIHISHWSVCEREEQAARTLDQDTGRLRFNGIFYEATIKKRSNWITVNG